MRVLVCPPKYFDVSYEINPWMNITNKPDIAKVLSQFDALIRIYEELGIEVEQIQQDSKHPDMVYTANDGFVEGNIFIKANYKFDERKGEADFAQAYFENKGYEIAKIPESISFEGEGDLLKIGLKYFMGYGKRSDKEAKPYLKEILEQEIIDLELINPYYYHLDTCFAPLNEDIVFINPNSFTKDSLTKIYDNFETIIESNEIDNKFLACNMLVCGNNIIVGKGISPTSKEILKDNGFVIHENDMSEYLKGGGSVKCCTLIIEN